jgi:glycosyltransferase involved in cell wall biosynthesis
LAAIRTAVRAVAERKFSWEQNVKRLTEIYEELI